MAETHFSAEYLRNLVQLQLLQRGLTVPESSVGSVEKAKQQLKGRSTKDIRESASSNASTRAGGASSIGSRASSNSSSTFGTRASMTTATQPGGQFELSLDCAPEELLSNINDLVNLQHLARKHNGNGSSSRNRSHSHNPRSPPPDARRLLHDAQLQDRSPVEQAGATDATMDGFAKMKELATSVVGSFIKKRRHEGQRPTGFPTDPESVVLTSVATLQDVLVRYRFEPLLDFCHFRVYS
jgi:hypothetical protein